jgi:copper chaperone CopZ
VNEEEHDMQTVQIKVSGMTCGGCERSVQNALASRAGVKEAKADRAAGIVSVQFDPALIQRPALEKAITEAGFQVAA